MRGRQRFQCLSCSRQFIPPTDRTFLRAKLWIEYVWHRQTLNQLAAKHQRSIPWVQKQLDLAPANTITPNPQPIIAVADATFWSRGYGILVVRCPRLKKNLHCHELHSETAAEYLLARRSLEAQGYVIEATVIDGKRGVLEVFGDIPVQLCQFHQIAAVRRYLTSRPKLEAGKELRALSLALKVLSREIFTDLLTLWYQRWHNFLKERTYNDDGIHWQYTHRRIRSAYRSLKTNLPYLFTYLEYPKLNIPSTTNSLDGYFSNLKQLLNIHRGLTIKRRYKLIQEILSK